MLPVRDGRTLTKGYEMKRHINAIVAVGLATVLAACGGGASDGGSGTSSPTPATTTTPAPDPTPTEQEQEQAEDESVTEAVLRMGIIDETTDGIPERFEVWIRGTGSWFYAQGFLQEAAGPFPTGKASSFFIYPEGRDTPEIEVELVVPPTVIPGSPRDLVTIEVYDDKILVFGTSVPEFEAIYER